MVRSRPPLRHISAEPGQGAGNGAYNVFNEVQFTNLNTTYTFTGTGNLQNTNTNTGKYTQSGSLLAAGTIQPRVIGVTARFDW